MTKSNTRKSVPQISLSNFLLTGHLITNTRASRALALMEEARYATRAKHRTGSKEMKQIEDVADRQPSKRAAQSIENLPKIKESPKVVPEEKTTQEQPRTDATDKDAYDMTAELFPFMGFEEPEQEVKAKDAPATTAPATSGDKSKQETETKDQKQHKEVSKGKKNSTNFSPEQDALILEMKAQGKAWGEMCSSVKAGKKQIQERYNTLSNIAALDSAGAKATTTSPATEVEEEKVASSKKSTSEAPPATATSAQLISDVEDLPPTTNLQADGNWTVQDCEILEMLEKRYRDQKWLHMQSQFYNYTGRMVQADIIKWKFGVKD